MVNEIQLRSRRVAPNESRAITAAASLTLDRGAFDADRLVSEDQSLGLLILDGLIIVQLGAGRSRAACLIGAGDLLRPWDVTEIAHNRDVRWRALTSVAARRISPELQRRSADPRIVRALLGRATRTTRWLLAQALVLGDSRVEDRLLMSFSLWAERWGRVTPNGIWVELPLTHELMAQLVGARRPTVTLALRSLESDELLTRHPRGGWLLDRRTYELNTVAGPRARGAEPISTAV